METKDLHSRDEADLKGLVLDLKRQLWSAKFKNLSNQLDDTSQISKLRRDVARANTILRQKEIQRSEQGADKSNTNTKQAARND